MRILVLGGYGEFGGRLARLLIRDGHSVLVAGRSKAAVKKFCNEHGGMPFVIDINGKLDDISDLAPDAVVDAAGPFQSYGADPYRVARAALAARAHYLDPSDDGAFAAGVTELDDLARSAGRFALSGASSTPALSSSAVAALRDELAEITVIETVILPGSRAPRGRSVMASVLCQAGNKISVWRGGRWQEAIVWSAPKTVSLEPGDVRKASLFAAPDVQLFPTHFHARSVLFRAGLEPALVDRGLTALAALRRTGLLPNLKRFSGPLKAIAGRLAPLGSDRGGMIVEAVGPRRSDGEFEMRRWTLVAEPGEGPFVPTIPVRAILREPHRIAPGARPCLAELPLTEYEKAMADLGVKTIFSVEPRPTLFRAALGPNWNNLSSEARRLHSVQDTESFSGRADVIRGTSPLARMAAAIFRFPRAGKNVSLTVIKTRTAYGEIWEREFGGRRFSSHLTPAGPDHFRERFMMFNYEQGLPVKNGQMFLPVRRGWCFGIPLPRLLLAGSESREYSADGVFRFDVSLLAPLGGALIVRYRGWVKPDADRDQT